MNMGLLAFSYLYEPFGDTPYKVLSHYLHHRQDRGSPSNEFCDELSSLKNATLVTNPSVVNIHSDKTFSGYNVLMYHGYSFDYYVANVDSRTASFGGNSERHRYQCRLTGERRRVSSAETYCAGSVRVGRFRYPKRKNRTCFGDIGNRKHTCIERK